MSDKQPKTYHYRKTTGKAAMLSSAVVVVVALIELIFMGYYRWHFRQYTNIAHDEVALSQWESVIESLESFLTSIQYGATLAFLISAVCVAKWVYDSQCNARALGVENIKYSPAKSVAVFFLPIVSWFLPFIAMRDMVNNSCEKASKPDFHWLMLLWWICFVLGGFITRYYAERSENLQADLSEAPSMVQLVDYLQQITHALSMVQVGLALYAISAIALVVIIRRTSQLHAQMHQAQTSYEIL